MASWQEGALLEGGVVDMEWVLPGDNTDSLSSQGTGVRDIAIASPDQINIYDLHTHLLRNVLVPDFDGIVDIAFSPDGFWLVAGSRQPAEDGNFVSVLEGWRREIDNSTGEIGWRHVGVINRQFGAGITTLEFTADSSTLFVAYTSIETLQEGIINVWQVSTWEIKELLETGTVLEIAVSGESSLLAATPNRYLIYVRDLTESETRYQLHTSFTGAVSSLVFSPDSLVLASGHYDGTIRLWNTITGEEFLSIQAGGIIDSLSFSPDGSVLASGNGDRDYEIKLWSPLTGELKRELFGQWHPVGKLLFSPDGQVLVSSSYDGTIRIWGIIPE